MDRSRLGLYARKLLDTWWIDWASILNSDELILDTSAVDEHFLDTSSTDTLIPLDTCICRDLLASLYKASAWSGSHFHRSLSRYFSVFSPKTLSSHSNLGSQGFFKVFQVFLYLVSFQSFFIHAFHVLKPRFWSFWKILGFFKIDELLLKFWIGFSLKCV